MVHNMLSNNEFLKDIWMETLHGTEIEEAVPSVVKMSYCKGVWHEFPHSIQMQTARVNAIIMKTGSMRHRIQSFAVLLWLLLSVSRWVSSDIFATSVPESTDRYISFARIRKALTFCGYFFPLSSLGTPANVEASMSWVDG